MMCYVAKVWALVLPEAAYSSPGRAAAGGLGCTAFVPVTLHKRSLLLIGTLHANSARYLLVLHMLYLLVLVQVTG